MKTKEERMALSRQATPSGLLTCLRNKTLNDVFEDVRFSEIENYDFSSQLISLAIASVYAASGRGAEGKVAECNLFAERFLQKYSKTYTPTDIVVFCNMIIDGEIEIHFMSVIDLFMAWKVYVAKRADAFEKLNRNRQRERTNASDYVDCTDLLKQQQKILANSTHWWEEFLMFKNGEKIKYNIEGVNVEYEQFRQRKLAELGLTTSAPNQPDYVY